jgi:hypothetical protein
MPASQEQWIIVGVFCWLGLCSYWTCFVGGGAGGDRQGRRWCCDTMMQREPRKRKLTEKAQSSQKQEPVSPRSDVSMQDAEPAAAAAASTPDTPPSQQHHPHPHAAYPSAAAAARNAVAPIAVLAAAGADASVQRIAQRSRRQRPNWSEAQDEELLRVAKTYHNSWTMALANSPMLRDCCRNAEALRARYKLLKDRWTRQQQRKVQRLLPPGQVGPQSADPGESLEEAVDDIDQLEPIDRSAAAQAATTQATIRSRCCCSVSLCALFRQDDLDRLLRAGPISPSVLAQWDVEAAAADATAAASGGAAAAASSGAAAAAAAPSFSSSPLDTQHVMLDSHFGEYNRLLQSQIAATQQSSAAPMSALQQQLLIAQLRQRVENSSRQRVLGDVTNIYKQLLAETTRIGDAQLAQQKQFAEEQLNLQRAAVAELNNSNQHLTTLLQRINAQVAAHPP